MRIRHQQVPSAMLIGWLLAWMPPPAISADDAEGVTEALSAQIRPSIATIRAVGRDGDERGIGTGFVVDSNGLIATNLHVINEGRSFSVEMSSGRELRVLSVEASDRTSDLALIRVEVDEQLPALPLADSSPRQGMRVLAFGNPLGLRDSVVEGIVSAVREVDGHTMIQLAMPIEPGNSGGPLVDQEGRVQGIVNMKSAIDDNLGFAVPIQQLAPLRENPNPVSMDRWARWGKVNEKAWTPLFGAAWRQTGGTISANGRGEGFGGRSLCLSTQTLPETPFEIAVRVRLDEQAGAAGLAFHSDGNHRHYGFYPSNGRLRLTCFRGPSVYSWQVLKELESDHYLPGQWNRLRVRIEEDRLRCFVNGHLVIESTDQQFASGQAGLVKFRDTRPEFKQFRVGKELPAETLSKSAKKSLSEWNTPSFRFEAITSKKVHQLGKSSGAVSRELMQRAWRLQQQAEQMRRLASDVRRVPTLEKLRRLMSQDTERSAGPPDRKNEPSQQDGAAADPNQLVRGALLIASLDQPEIDPSAYETRIEQMAQEIHSELDESAAASSIRAALDTYLFGKNGFHGSRTEYYHRANSHLNRVIDDREGLPITLSILYMELGRQLGLRIEGIGLPGHFVVQHVPQEGPAQLIDVFDGGKDLSRSDAADLVAQTAGRSLRDADLRAQSTREILTRVLRNLLGSASGERDVEAMLRYSEALVAVAPNAERRWMRGQLRAMTGRQTRAREDFDWLLETAPSGIDLERIRQMRRGLAPSD